MRSHHTEDGLEETEERAGEWINNSSTLSHTSSGRVMNIERHEEELLKILVRGLVEMFARFALLFTVCAVYMVCAVCIVPLRLLFHWFRIRSLNCSRVYSWNSIGAGNPRLSWQKNVNQLKI